MTGYGRGRATSGECAAEVELRSVNGRGFSLKTRLPSERLEIEPKLEALLHARIERGTVQANVRLRFVEGRAGVVEHKVLRRYLKEWRKAEKELGLESREPSLGELLALPGAVELPEESGRARSAAAEAVLAAAELALAALLASRQREGEKLRRELSALGERLQRLCAALDKKLPQVARDHGQRLKERVAAAWKAAGVTEPMDLTRELAVLAEKADVREEMARLGIHLERLHKLLRSGGPCGRELEFLIQECHREVTTLGNKCNDAGVSETVIAMKVAAQRLKEQAANVE